MNISMGLMLPLHMLAAIVWVGLAVVVAMNAGGGGEKAFRWQMIAAVVAFATGAGLWNVYYGSRFEAAQKVLAFGIVCAIAAAGVQGVMVGRSRRKLKNGTMTEEAARPKIARANQIAAGLLILTVVAMVMARQL